VNVESLAYDQEWYLARGVVRERVDINQVVDMQYVEYALSRLGRYAR
jgi:hypothetical protein